VLHGVALTAAAVAAAQRGDRDRMERLISEAHAVSRSHPDVAALSSVARVTYWARRDDVARMSAELETAMAALRGATALPVPERGLSVLLRAVEGRDAEEAIAELDRSPGATHLMNQVYRTYATAVVLGRRGDVDGAVQHMARADGSIQPLAWFQHHARRLVAEAALADGWGDPVAWLREALAYFDDGGYDELAGSCRALLAKAGAPVPRRAAGDDAVPPDLRAHGVTARELEVLELLAEARSTREIATKLFLSPKTVERHVANLVAKLGVHGRSGLVAFAASRLSNQPT
jgi:DNA-binding CsgD family transcriptional regulator